jgi:hypothetical protein
MQLRWKLGFLRLWVMLAIVWVALFGWREYSAQWIDLHASGECWDRLAKWPDGKRFDDWDLYFNDGAPGSNNENDRWRDVVREKLKACEHAEPIVRQLTDWASDNDSALKSSLILTLLPPFILLFFGLCVGWIVSGFKPKTS